MLITAPWTFLSSWPVSRIQYRYLAAAFAVFALSVFLLSLPFVFPVLYLGHVNWSGKLFSIVGVYTIILSRKRSDPAREFMTFRQKEGTLWQSLGIVLLLLLFSVAVSLLDSEGGRPPTDRALLAYEATLPGIDEEAVFRAAFLRYVLAAADGKPCGKGGRAFWRVAGPISASAMLFGLVHALHVDAALHMHFDIATLAIAGTVGAGLALLTVNSGSILLPVIAHNLANLVATLV
ncbi:CPBP family intramembrane metalloprotease [Robbsia sp. Bb-Pol-6]|uniref:CPBP family intramembrane metalloprotease n=1 Tax=Robbsia betulipollinis TaxID=2981849 RepID=A0ABT3ZHU0_9BURK|nr:CPBP family intramembrane glutamic endopeptidase [Robbsia betulipollinis]MCY0386095.1 CPBP family intramembrane metalloprotease [Robbsia betulipollinis]